MSERAYRTYCVATAVALVALKLWIGRHVPATAMLADDYENLNRSIYVVHGDFRLNAYPFKSIAYGPLYPLVVSPWLLFQDPALRLQTVFAINAALSALAVVFGSLTVLRLTGARSLLVPLCLAAYPPLFQFSFYAVTENLLLPMLAVVGWLAVDFAETRRRPGRLGLLFTLAVLLPLVRVPGLAVAPALVVLAWRHRRALFGRRAGVAIALAIVLPIVAYVVGYRLLAESNREEAYLGGLAQMAAVPGFWRLPAQLVVSQLRYLFLSTGYWVLPLVLVIALQARRFAVPARERWIDYLLFASVAGAGFLAFAIAHLTLKQRVAWDGQFVFGRYDDPAGFVLFVAGLAGVFALEPPTVVQKVILRVVAPAAFCLVLASGVLASRWVPVNDAGLSILALGSVSIGVVLLVTAAAAALSQLVDERRAFASAALAFVLVLGAFSDRQGMRYTMARANIVSHILEGSTWIAAHLPPDARLGYDGRVIATPAPNTGNIRVVGDVYRAMMFATHPRPTVVVDSDAALARVDYLYSTLVAPAWGGVELTRVWANTDYALYRVSPAVSTP